MVIVTFSDSYLFPTSLFWWGIFYAKKIFFDFFFIFFVVIFCHIKEKYYLCTINNK